MYVVLPWPRTNSRVQSRSMWREKLSLQHTYPNELPNFRMYVSCSYHFPWISVTHTHTNVYLYLLLRKNFEVFTKNKMRVVNINVNIKEIYFEALFPFLSYQIWFMFLHTCVILFYIQYLLTEVIFSDDVRPRFATRIKQCTSNYGVVHIIFLHDKLNRIYTTQRDGCYYILYFYCIANVIL